LKNNAFWVFLKQRPLKVKKKKKILEFFKKNFEHFAKNPICNIKNNAGMGHPSLAIHTFPLFMWMIQLQYTYEEAKRQEKYWQQRHEKLTYCHE
jgi:hypothetical protein